MTMPPTDHDDLPRRPGRVHMAARQRGTDITALGSLALHVPHVAASLAVVFVVSYALSYLSNLPWWLLLGCWVVSGALVFHRPCERLMARWLFRLRYPTPEEDGRLRPVWREVTARAGVDAGAYQLWIEESDAVNAMAAAGHIVGVTSHSLRTLTPGQLAGVLAHELGHHARGHAWASLLSLWYALPARLAWRLLLRLATRLDRLPTGVAAVVIGVTGAVVVALATATYGLIFLPLATPYLVAAVSRRSELRADEHAAGLGFAPQLMAVLHQERLREESRRVPATALGAASTKDGMIARLLDSHPDVHTRLHRLQARPESRR
ncbi:M48 family metalloprotease [Streptomyces coeruleorubidus]|uniref:M48 family metalloprotease n=1 Tax=Streptomyces coeruleorubidus TaxID=116188 RepID=A0ABZ0KB01_STRC4|nr:MULTISPECIES: M48 family metalloprotease [Streptomyces]WOT34920.1 M48 family metalloprotease [Streptomyces coeruleorubidus]GGU10819.1 peptidase M48 [Streptomyces bellus]